MSLHEERRLALPQGRLVGAVATTAAGPCLAFRSIPYAAAPVGALRFKPPQLPAPWQGERDASQVGPVLPQLPSRLANVMGSPSFAQAEDALTLTVWTPSTKGRRAVLVWWHGGAFTSGGGDMAWYDGARLAAEQGIVVVAVNYRLGALGFLCVPGVSEGNLGLLDQEASLAWVRQHVDAFGGDPAQVTVMGQSAGGISIAHQLSRPGWWARRAIIQSAPLSLAPQSVEVAGRTGEAFLQALGIEPGAADALARAQAATLEQVLAAQGAASRAFAATVTNPADVGPPFVPVSDGKVIGGPGAFAADMARAAGQVDIMIGTTRDESTCFLLDNQRLQGLQSLPLSAGEASYWQARRPGGTPLECLADYATWEHFEGATRQFVRDAVTAGRKAFMYRFDWAPPTSRYGATHCIDLPFVFGTHEAYGHAAMIAGARPEPMRGLSGTLRAAVGAFVREGDPAAADGLLAWPVCTPRSLVRLHWNEVCEVAGVVDVGTQLEKKA